MPVTEFLDSANIEWITQGMSNEDCLGLFGECFFKLGNVYIVGSKFNVKKNWDATILDNWVYGGGESRSNAYNLVTRLDCASS
jgi:hypothetical protein